MRTVNISEIPGRQYEAIGLVKGSSVRGTAKNISAIWQNFLGGEMTNYAKILDEARYAATKRMADEAENLGADMVINVTYGSTNITDGAVEIIAYGTAVRFTDTPDVP